MTDYNALDVLIVQTVRGGATTFNAIFTNSDVKKEAQRLARISKRDADRVVDGRLQALRKLGRLVFASAGRGWGAV